MADKPHIRQREFKDLNLTPIEKHKRSGKDLISWYNTLPGDVRFHSWKDQALPNILWAAVVATSLARDDYLQAFRLIAAEMRQSVPEERERFIVHNYLSTLPYEEFATVFAPIKRFPDAYRALSTLRLVESLPDHSHWTTFTAETLQDNPWDILARAIADPFDHQSQIATDIRWLKVIQLAISGRVSFSEQHEDIVEEFRLYPDKGDMRQVRPSIRAMEMTFRSLEYGDEVPAGVPQSAHEEFWAECHGKTHCIVAENTTPERPAHSQLLEELRALGLALAEHFERSEPSTGPNPRKDATFGLALYAVDLCIECAVSYSYCLPSGRISLRSVVE